MSTNVEVETDWLRHLTIARLAFVLEARQPMWLPAYKGSTFRGAFGTTFRNLFACSENCGGSCPYHYIFETPNPGLLDWFDSPHLPHPFVLEPPLDDRSTFQPGEELTFHLVLVGRGVDYFPYFIYTFDRIGRHGGLGKGRAHGLGRYVLKAVYDTLATTPQPCLVYDGERQDLLTYPTLLAADHFEGSTPCHRLLLHFLTATRIKHRRRYLLMGGDRDLPPVVLLQNLLRRSYLLTFAHCSQELDALQLPDQVDWHIEWGDLHWQDWERFSSTQEIRMKLGGFVGKLELWGELTPWMQPIRVGELLHVGKATSFGMGKYRIVSTN